MSDRFNHFCTIRRQLVCQYWLSAITEGVLLTCSAIGAAATLDYWTDFPAGLDSSGRWLVLTVTMGVVIGYCFIGRRRIIRFSGQSEPLLIRFWESELGWPTGELSAALDFDRRLDKWRGEQLLKTGEVKTEKAVNLSDGKRRTVEEVAVEEVAVEIPQGAADEKRGGSRDPYLTSPELASRAVQQVADNLKTALTAERKRKVQLCFLPIKRLVGEIAVWILAIVVLAVFGPDWATIQTALYRVTHPQSQILYPTSPRQDDSEFLSKTNETTAQFVPEPEIQSIRLRVTPPRAALEPSYNAPTAGTVIANSQIRFSVLISGTPDSVSLCVQRLEEPVQRIPVPFLGPGKKVGKSAANWYSVQIPWPRAGEYWITASREKQRDESERWTIKTRPDQLPTIELTGTGESTLEIVPEALVPWSIQASDDFGLLTLSLRWRILGESEISTGTPPSRLVYQREPLFNAFSDDSIQRPPKRFQTTKLWNPGSLELKPGAAVKIQLQAEDTARQESETPEILLRVVSRDQINDILFALRLRQEAEILRAQQALDQILKNPDQIEQNQSLYREFARQVWNEPSGIESQLKSLVQRVRMNHVNWGRTLTNIDSYIYTLNQVNIKQNVQIRDLFDQLRRVSVDIPQDSRKNQLISVKDGSEKDGSRKIGQTSPRRSGEIQSELLHRITLVRDAFQSFSQEFVQWTRYRELTERFRNIEKETTRLLDRTTEGGDIAQSNSALVAENGPDSAESGTDSAENGPTKKTEREALNNLERLLVDWRQTAGITQSAMEAAVQSRTAPDSIRVLESASDSKTERGSESDSGSSLDSGSDSLNSVQNQLRAINVALEQYQQDSPLKRLYYFRMAYEQKNSVLFSAAGTDFRASISRIAALLNAQGDRIAEQRLLLKSDIEQLRLQQADLIRDTSSLLSRFSSGAASNTSNTSNTSTTEVWDRISSFEADSLIKRQEDLAHKTGTLSQTPYPVLADSLIQAKELMNASADLLSDWKQNRSETSPFAKEQIETPLNASETNQPGTEIGAPTRAENSRILLIQARQADALETLAQLVESLEEAERLTILALNRSEDTTDKISDQSSNETEPKNESQKKSKEENLGTLAAKISIEDLKMLQLAQLRLLNQTRQAYQSALENQPTAGQPVGQFADNLGASSTPQNSYSPVKVNPATAALLAQRQQRLASLCWYLTTAATPTELLQGKRPTSNLAETDLTEKVLRETNPSTTDRNPDLDVENGSEQRRILQGENNNNSDSLDDELLGDLNEPLPDVPLSNQSSSSSGEPGLNQNDESNPEIQRIRQKRREEEKRFEETLWNQLGTAAVSEEDAPLLEIVRYMRQTYELFQLCDCGDINQGLQEQTCEHLDKLMNQLSFSKSPGKATDSTSDESDPQKSIQSDSDSGSDSPNEEKPQPDLSSDAKSQDQNDSNADSDPNNDSSAKQSTPGAPRAGEKTGFNAPETFSPEELRALQRRFWGELPLELQRSLKQLSEPVYPKAYKESIDRYFQTLSNPTSNPTSTPTVRKK